MSEIQMDKIDRLMGIEGEILKCVDCGCGWGFRAGERKFYETKGLRIPKRCPDCRKRRRESIDPPPEAAKGVNHDNG